MFSFIASQKILLIKNLINPIVISMKSCVAMFLSNLGALNQIKLIRLQRVALMAKLFFMYCIYYII